MVFTKPKFLSEGYAEFFQDESVVAVYHKRPRYPDETFEFLGSLISDEPRRVLDVGCGLGELARGLLPYADHIDAVDFSPAMVARGSRLEGGDDPKLHWQCSRIEEAELKPPYALITAGSSLGWFDLNLVMPRFSSMLTADGYLAIVGRDEEIGVDDLEFIKEFSANQDHVSFNLIDALVEAALFQVSGKWQSQGTPWRPTVQDFLDFRHSQNGGARDRMGPDQAEAFDKAVRDRIHEQADAGTAKIEDGRLQGTVVADIVWGKPLAGL